MNKYKDDIIYIEHILDSIQKIEKYTKGIIINDFYNSELIQDGVIRNLEIIGEATKGLSEQFRISHSEIPWKKMAGMRDILVHNYMGIDTEAVQETIQTDLPRLKEQTEKIIKR